MNKKTLLGEEIEEVVFYKNKIVVLLKNGIKFKCKPVGSMNFTATLQYSKEFDSISNQ